MRSLNRTHYGSVLISLVLTGACSHRPAGSPLALSAAAADRILPGAPRDEIDNYIEAQLQRLRIPGLALAVVRDGEIVKAAGYGYANLELLVPVTASTVFEIGSITKPFTAVAIMMLVEDEKLSLEDELTTFFPQAPEAWSRITVRHLLSHTGGIQNYAAVASHLAQFHTSIFMEAGPAREDLLALFYNLPIELDPGARGPTTTRVTISSG